MISSNIGKFITIEGVEGVGKTTNIDFIRQWLEQRKIPHITTREPGGTPLAESIRELLLSPRDETVDENTELLLILHWFLISLWSRGLSVLKIVVRQTALNRKNSLFLKESENVISPE